MKLPNAHQAKVERDKVVSYLLNPDHRFGASKARFFAAFGFRAESWTVLADAFREHAVRNDVSKVKETGFGPRYDVDGRLEAPNGASPRIRTVWQVDLGEDAPRLITAYPLEER